ncbi:threonine/serine ThrE exporter family protein [Volucribacter amazonae]|uniref:Threonine/serine exporter-like N-terminal domain-containing protein n=1 Tax=Volucribacter amazonae TaxID=256731 RepID=A0A9X4PAK6_9PAST|nr:threonine/serine exporter ThrE family protein [Volucribacter amazonae]MDG6895533.1 hypothetical protein [Volucribacter amazonae]
MANLNISYEVQQDITRVCAYTALLLLQHGAESTLIVQITERLGLALGIDSVECALTPNAIILTTRYQDRCITTTRKNQDKGINMYIVTEVQHIMLAAEHKIYDLAMVKTKLNQLAPLKYNRWLVIVMIGLSCAAFARLSGGDIITCAITFVAAMCAMFVRQVLAIQHYNPIIVFAITAFVATLIAGLGLKYELGNDPQIAIASSVLLLVPGFPLINALADVLKGHVNMGIGRWAIATILTLGACMGIVSALSLLNIHQWGGY